MILSQNTFDLLKSCYSDSGIERGGYIAKGVLYECENESPNPIEIFKMKISDLEEMEKAEAECTFHTHVNGSMNLSMDDYQSFIDWADMKHIIVGKDGVKCYAVNEKGNVVVEEIEIEG